MRRLYSSIWMPSELGTDGKGRDKSKTERAAAARLVIKEMQCRVGEN